MDKRQAEDRKRKERIGQRYLALRVKLYIYAPPKA